MALHIFHDLTLEVQQDRPDAGAELERLLQNLSFVPAPAGARQPCLRLTVHWQARPQVPASAGPRSLSGGGAVWARTW